MNVFFSVLKHKSYYQWHGYNLNHIEHTYVWFITLGRLATLNVTMGWICQTPDLHSSLSSWDHQFRTLDQIIYVHLSPRGIILRFTATGDTSVFIYNSPRALNKTFPSGNTTCYSHFYFRVTWFRVVDLYWIPSSLT